MKRLKRGQVDDIEAATIENSASHFLIGKWPDILPIFAIRDPELLTNNQIMNE